MNANPSIAFDPRPGNGTGGSRMLPAWLRTQEILIRVLDRFGDWQERSAARRRLMTLDERALADLALNRDSIDAEASKPFWKA